MPCCKWQLCKRTPHNMELEMRITPPLPPPPLYATLRSDNSHAAPVPCQNRRASCAPGGLATYTISVIPWPGAIIVAHLLLRPRQLFNVKAKLLPRHPPTHPLCIKALCPDERCVRRFSFPISEDNQTNCCLNAVVHTSCKSAEQKQ